MGKHDGQGEEQGKKRRGGSLGVTRRGSEWVFETSSGLQGKGRIETSRGCKDKGEWGAEPKRTSDASQEGGTRGVGKGRWPPCAREGKASVEGQLWRTMLVADDVTPRHGRVG